MRTLVVHRPAALCLLLGLGCATTQPTNGAEPLVAGGPELASTRAVPITSEGLPSGLDEAVTAYCAAWTAGDWSTVWGLTAAVDRAELVAVGRRIAERHEATARTQGFASAASVKALSDEAWFTGSRAGLRAAGTLPELAGVAELSAKSPVEVPFGAQRVAVVPVKLTLANGKHVTLGAVQEGGVWRFISPS